MPTKLLQPLTVVGGVNFWIGPSLLYTGFPQNLLPLIKKYSPYIAIPF